MGFGMKCITRRFQQSALCLHHSVQHPIGQPLLFADHAETIPHVHHLLERKPFSASSNHVQRTATFVSCSAFYQHWDGKLDGLGGLVAPGFTNGKLLCRGGLPCNLLLEGRHDPEDAEGERRFVATSVQLLNC